MKPVPEYHVEAVERRRQERKIWRTGLLLSLVVHLLLFLEWQGPVIPDSPFSARGPRAGDYRAAGGSMEAMNLSVPASRPIIRPPVPLAVEIEVEPVVIAADPAPDPASVLGEAPGRGTGTGSGDASGAGPGRGGGGNADEGLYRLEPPTPRGMIIPPANKNLKGTTVEVWVFVNEQGRVVPDSTRLNPPTKDGGFNQRLMREAAEWVFRPATKAGQAVASWFPYQISMYGNQVSATPRKRF
ncbi:MAG TPA: hypothetical protein VJ997_06200 [Longimicrobiales bacterium]|nr:hypothetical protein [Longimicrobiales bacterium]